LQYKKQRHETSAGYKGFKNKARAQGVLLCRLGPKSCFLLGAVNVIANWESNPRLNPVTLEAKRKVQIRLLSRFAVST